MYSYFYTLKFCVQVEAHYEEEKEILERDMESEKQELITKYRNRQVGIDDRILYKDE